jgi:hypothetical protein
VNAPAATGSAAEIVVCGSVSDARLSQERPAANAGTAASKTTLHVASTILITCLLSSGGSLPR